MILITREFVTYTAERPIPQPPELPSRAGDPDGHSGCFTARIHVPRPSDGGRGDGAHVDDRRACVEHDGAAGTRNPAIVRRTPVPQRHRRILRPPPPLSTDAAGPAGGSGLSPAAAIPAAAVSRSNDWHAGM